ncbi:restriction endonuclease subunit S [Dermabacter sp.]|uniref:restriction endonuclease subunit S n=1 Tax=Dermabacter sp. TaxID=37640 RepID=UPI002913756E|nr:restriction endonuclease subunit S [Dermabacter sp.]MDU4922778.1 restriction endonuclease subunit S [Dermabacter sp.]
MTDWQPTPFGALFRRLPRRIGHPHEELLSVYRDFGVIRKTDRDDNHNRPGALEDYQLVRPGDLVFNKMKAWQGSLGISSIRGIVSPAYFVYEPLLDNDSTFMHYALRSQDSIDYYAAHSTGIRVNQWDLSPEWLDMMKLPVPGYATQRRIADYLDDEVRKIDDLATELGELIENLELRRGAKTDALVNASGSNDLPLGIIADIKIGKMLAASSDEESKDLPYLRAAHIQPAGRLDLSVEEKRMEFSAAEREAFSLRKGDILIVEGGAGYGRSVLLSEDLPNMGFQNSVNRVRVKKSMVNAKFVYYMLQSAKMNGRIEMVCDTATIPHFTSEKVSRFRIPVPSLEKQREIADELDRETAEMDFLIKEATELIENLKARKTALITEVVTGRKKV